MNDSMKKWKMIRNITLATLVIFVILILLIGLAFMFDNGTYPDDIFGLTKLKAFYAVISFVLVFTGIPLLINIVLLIVSQLKVKNFIMKEDKNES